MSQLVCGHAGEQASASAAAANVLKSMVSSSEARAAKFVRPPVPASTAEKLGTVNRRLSAAKVVWQSAELDRNRHPLMSPAGNRWQFWIDPLSNQVATLAPLSASSGHSIVQGHRKTDLGSVSSNANLNALSYNIGGRSTEDRI